MDQDLERMTSLLIKFFVGIAIGYFVGSMLFTSARADDHEMIVKEVYRQSAVYPMDPELALAVIEVESNFNPKKTGEKGEIGLFQLMPVYFPNARYDLTENIKLGVVHMGFVKQNCPVKRDLTWIICYNQGLTRHPKHPELLPYYRKVMNVYKKNKAKNRQAQ